MTSLPPHRHTGQPAGMDAPREVEDEPFTGACRCGAVRFECSSPQMTTDCHCADCRGWSGTAYLTNVGFPAASFQFTQGVDNVTGWTNAATTRTFCKTCGTHLTTCNTRSPVPVIGVARGLLADDARIPDAVCHLHVAEKPAWYDIAGLAPRFDHWPRFPERDSA